VTDRARLDGPAFAVIERHVRPLTPEQVEAIAQVLGIALASRAPDERAAETPLEI
jgi:hypothetical protein